MSVRGVHIPPCVEGDGKHFGVFFPAEGEDGPITCVGCLETSPTGVARSIYREPGLAHVPLTSQEAECTPCPACRAGSQNAWRLSLAHSVAISSVMRRVRRAHCGQLVAAFFLAPVLYGVAKLIGWVLS